MAVISCSKENVKGEGNGGNGETVATTVVSALIEDDFSPSDVKTSLVDSEQDRYIRWTEGDAIGIFGDNSTYNSSADLDDDSSVGKTTGRFLVGGPFSNPEFAYYPYNAKASYFEGTLGNVSIPVQQTYVEGKVFSGEGCLMVGLYSGGVFKFRNACSLLEVQLTGSETVSEIQLCSFTKVLAGEGSVNVNSTPVFVPDETKGSKTVTLTLKTPVTLSSTPKAFYFIVAPGTYKDLIVRVKNGEGVWTSTASTQQHILQRKHILPMNPFNAGKPSVEGAVSLSENGYANTYVLGESQTGLYSFDVKHVDGEAFANDKSDPAKCGLFADILWESEACLVGDVYYDAAAGKIYFRKARPDAGNALICLFNSSEKVLWSWLIWCSDVKDQTWGASGSRYTFLDRFIGATWVPSEAMDVPSSTSISAGENAQLVASTGFLYQYGRPIPVPGCNSMSTTRRYEGENTNGVKNVDGKDINGNVLKTDTWMPVFHNFYTEYSTGWETRNQLWTLEESLSHPLSSNKIWESMSKPDTRSYATGINATGPNALWKVEKTNYDPCPAGYRVPQAKELEIFHDDGNGQLEYVNGTASSDKRQHGYYGAYTTREGNFIWLPKAGFRTMGSNASSNSYAFTMGYWGNYRFNSNTEWFDGTVNMWTFDPTDSQATLQGGYGWGNASSWASTATGDMVQRFYHLGSISSGEGPKQYTGGNGKPVICAVGDALSVRCVKIQ